MYIRTMGFEIDYFEPVKQQVLVTAQEAQISPG